MFLSLSPYSLLDSDIKDNLRTKYIYMLPAHMFFMSFVKVTTFSPHGGSRVSLTCCQCILGLRPLRNSRASVQWALLQFSSVAQLCPTVCDPMNRSTPGLPVHHHLPEFTQIHIHRVRDAIQPSHPQSSPSPPAPNPSQHQSLFQ